jgi:pilus assembly protein CpaE
LGYLQKDRISIVINRYLKKSEISLKDAEASLERKILWTIPNDYKTTISAINLGKSLSQIASKAPTTMSLKELADYLSQGKEERGKIRWKFLNNR